MNEMKFLNGIPDDLAENLAKIDDLGGPKTYNHYPTGWAMAFNTPFKMWKRYEFNGGTSDPCIMSWPQGMKARAARSESSTTTPWTSCPPFWTCSEWRVPKRCKGYVQSRLRRCEHALQLRRRLGADGAEDAVLLDARLPGHLAQWLESSHDPPGNQWVGPLQRRRRGSSTTPMSIGQSFTTSPPSTPIRCASW